ncbi:peptidase C14 [Colletotrichum higginsianum]|uniref:Peptidase C14 n=1 Tax=Colletotrichum higginsianum (strain IMI 349063) TaxID=759273 RepID=H1V5T2_COLHI|nr:peptidase C14 [Colletotrichum higginsianum]
MASGGLILLLAGVAAVGFLWLYRPARALSATIPSATYLEQNRGVQLRQVNLCADNDGETGKSIDIIAIHGLDTKSPETWEYRTPDGQKVNWLQDRHMLPAEVSNARIFTCNWPAELLETLDSDQDTLEELALLLLAGVQGRPPATNDRPILFIASCLGGIILTKALVTAKSEYLPVRNATRGIIFLATPFRGTSFEDVARWAEPGLRAWASIQGRQVTRLLDWVKSPAFDLIRLVGEFTQLCDNGNGKGYKVLTFYETQYTNLPAKIPFLSFLFSPSKKQFRGPKDSDPDYKLVVDQIRHCLEEIRKGTPLERADAWIREKHYTQERLKIERLSGDLLSMDQCYINLALVETQRADRSKDTPEERALRPSPFSLSDRLKIKTPHENIQVKLEALFDLRKMPDGHIKPPRRILIRGRAGIGKTTLCKKIVYDFTHGTLWHDKFDRLLWIPLRNLKREARTNVPGYSMGHLFLHEYFSSPGATDLINALWIETHSEKTLFILDGLDEISSDLRDDMFQFLKELLNQPNIILTSRPHAVLPSGLKPLDLELETIGFYPQQVGEYIRACCKMTTANGIETFLQGRQLIRDLVRIPIQLDALCFTWDGLNAGPSLQTMTEFYMAIEERLWKKDGCHRPRG